MSTTDSKPDAQLTCVHVLGPDTLIAQPDMETAKRRAEEWNASFPKRRVPNDIVFRCEVEPWPYSAKAHADDLAHHGGSPDDIC